MARNQVHYYSMSQIRQSMVHHRRLAQVLPQSQKIWDHHDRQYQGRMNMVYLPSHCEPFSPFLKGSEASLDRFS